MDRFIAMTAFRRVAEVGSFSKAARDLGASTASVSKHVAALEDALGARLLHRTTRRLSLTEIGAGYLERAARVLDDLAEIEADVRQEHAEPRGKLHVNAPMSFGIVNLGDMIARLMARHRELAVDLDLTDRHVDPVREGVDVVVRIAAELTDSTLVARRVGTLPVVACAAPKYFERRGVPSGPKDLAEHECLVYTLAQVPGLWVFGDPARPTRVRVTGRLRANNSIVMRGALLAGVGVTVIPRYIVADELDSGALRALFADTPPVPLGVYAVYPPQRQLSAKVRVFIEELAASLEATGPLSGAA